MMSAERRGDGNDMDGRAAASADDLSCIVTLSGDFVSSFTGRAPSAALTAAAGAMARDAERTARHLGFGNWEALIVESTGGALGVAPSVPDGDQFAVIGLPPDTPAGAAQRAAVRLAAERVPT
ncbi:MAG TPA: hypothetical protein VMM17_10145 [Gemmatimonadaceae bacterium]|nr:hypothetical protein [Gemmatimonadaceae bacterium]